jgi:hypothetical protein
MTIHLKRMGLSFDAIARGQAHALIAILDSVTFPSDYTIIRQPCHNAFRKATYHEPSLEVEEFKTLDNARREVDARDLAVNVERLSVLGLKPKLVQ